MRVSATDLPPNGSAKIDTPETPLLTLKPTSGWSAINARELYQYRDLMAVFATRDIKLRYRQTLLGPIWILLQPLLGAGVLAFVFGGIAHLKAPGDMPYFLFTYTGQLGFAIFSGIVAKVSGSLIGNAHLVSKVYFPRLLLPFSTVIAVMVDFGASAIMLPILMLCFHAAPGLPLLLLPIWITLFVLLAMGIGLCAAALMVSYRDVTAVLNVFMGFMPYLSAVGFDVHSLNPRIKPFVAANPVAGILEGFRWSVLNMTPPTVGQVAYASICSIAVFVIGLFFFRRMEKRFADII